MRSKNICQHGKAKLIYIDASSDISIYETKEEKPGLSTLPREEKEKKYGLSILPDFDTDIANEQKHIDKEVCLICGMDKQNIAGNQPPKCPNCGNAKYTKAIESE